MRPRHANGRAWRAPAWPTTKIIRRNGAEWCPFEPNKIAKIAMMKAFLAVHGTQGAASASVREVVDS
jgi:ribonucleoside-diphosphate reductase alpha chain